MTVIRMILRALKAALLGSARVVVDCPRCGQPMARDHGCPRCDRAAWKALTDRN